MHSLVEQQAKAKPKRMIQPCSKGRRHIGKTGFLPKLCRKECGDGSCGSVGAEGWSSSLAYIELIVAALHVMYSI